MEQKKKTLLFYVRGIGEYTDFLTTAKLLVNDYHIVMVNEISVDGQGQGYLRQRAEDLGCECHDLTQRMAVSSKMQLFFRLLTQYQATIPLTLYTVLSSLMRLRIQGVQIVLIAYRVILLKSFLKDILIKTSPCALIVNNVNGGTLGELAIACAREQGVKSIMMPYTFILPVAPARIFVETPARLIHGLKRRITEAFFPEWMYVYKGHHLLRKKTLFEILTLKLLKASPPMPWIQDSSTADVMAVESEFMKSHYESLGIRHPDMRVIGKPNQDYLSSLHGQKDVLAQTLQDELQFTQKKPFLLLAIPPRFIGFKEKEGRESEFTDYEEIVAFLLDTVSQLRNFNVLLCLHPRERIRLGEAIFRKDALPGHMRYSTRDTAELMSVSEVYIMAGSSTALWALALKLPVIDYDVYGFGFDFFGDNPDVVPVNKKQKFKEMMAQLDGDPDFLAHKKALLGERGDYYGLLDGQNVVRIKQLIDGLATV